MERTDEEEAIHKRADCQCPEADVGRRAEDIGREIGVSKHTIYACNKDYGGLSSDDARRLRHLEEENRRLKHIVADRRLDREVLKRVLKEGLELVSPRQDLAFGDPAKV